MKLADPTITVLGRDPPTMHRMNCNSFQQSALISCGNYQYAVFYTSATPANASPRHVNISRKELASVHWETITLEDYEQTIDDGHNTISLGICEGDGTLHLAFDAHCEGLKYRISRRGVATGASETKWTLEDVGFSEVLDMLPDCEDEEVRELLGEMTYPRFLSVDNGEMVFECRIGMAGRGSCVLFRYGPLMSEVEAEREGLWRWRFLGRYLVGEGCSPYLNGISWEPPKQMLQRDRGRGKIHVSWTNRHFVEYEDQTGEAHKQQAGPNGPENNADLGYMWSGDGGCTWKNAVGGLVTDLRQDRMNGAVSTRSEVIAIAIPKNSGIMNQEGQCVNAKDCSFHVLMRDTHLTSKGCMWRHSWLGTRGDWCCRAVEEEGVRPTEVGRRGRIAANVRDGSVWFVLPGNVDESLIVGRRALKDASHLMYGELEVLWRGEGFDGEPLIDEGLLSEKDRLSVVTRTAGSDEGKNIVVLDFGVDGFA